MSTPNMVGVGKALIGVWYGYGMSLVFEEKEGWGEREKKNLVMSGGMCIFAFLKYYNIWIRLSS